jgi:hypothetical protein
MTGKASRHNTSDTLYGALSFSTFSVEQARKDLVVLNGKAWYVQ